MVLGLAVSVLGFLKCMGVVLLPFVVIILDFERSLELIAWRRTYVLFTAELFKLNWGRIRRPD